MTAHNVVQYPVIGHNRLEYVKRQIVVGHERIVQGGSEWIEGSLQMAIALREARDLITDNISFKDWIKQNALDFLSHHDRAALINLASNIDLARTILNETDSKSYQRIWGANRTRFTSASKTPATRATRKSNRNTKGSRMTYRAMKLGDDTMAKIKGTSLDSAAEMDELIMLNRGSEPGQLTEIVRRLVDDAAAGKDVSALAESTKLCNGRRVTTNLIDAWRKRMVSTWETTDANGQLALLLYLVTHSKWEDQDDLLTQLLDQHHEAGRINHGR